MQWFVMKIFSNIILQYYYSKTIFRNAEAVKYWGSHFNYAALPYRI